MNSVAEMVRSESHVKGGCYCNRTFLWNGICQRACLLHVFLSFCFCEIKNAAMVIAFPQNSVAQNFRHETRAQTWRCDVPEKQLIICREPARVIKMAFEGGSILRAVLGAGHAVPQIHLLSLLASRCASTAILQTPRMEGPSRPVPNDTRRVDLGETRSYRLVFVV